MSLLKFPIKRFMGMNCIGDTTDLQDNVAYEVRDIIFSPHNAISTRPGFVKQNTTTLGYPIYGVYHFKTKVVNKKICVDGNGTVSVI